MNLHEFQAKQLFAEFGVPVPEGRVVASAEQARRAASELGGARWVVKAQVHAGGRGKAGGVALVDSADSVADAAGRMLGSRLVTKQTGEPGLPINQLLVEKTSNIARELYLSALVDRQARRVLFMGSVAGGMNIEEVAAETPEKLFTLHVDPVAGLQRHRIEIGVGDPGDPLRPPDRVPEGRDECRGVGPRGPVDVRDLVPEAGASPFDVIEAMRPHLEESDGDVLSLGPPIRLQVTREALLAIMDAVAYERLIIRHWPFQVKPPPTT